MENFTLSFGKFKGQQFLSTPTWYQEWLPKQTWFKMPVSKEIIGWGVYEIPTKEGRLFANAKPRLEQTFDSNLDAHEFCIHLNSFNAGASELYDHYNVLPIYK